jgi:rhamnosyl/mannosyltransferase
VKVLHIFKDYFPPTVGGIEQHIHEVVHSLDGFEFTVLTSSRSRRAAREDDDEVRVVRTPEYGRLLSNPLTPAWPRLLRRLRPDLLHVHMPAPGAELAFLAAQTAVPLVASYHADIVRGPGLARAYRPFQQAFLRRAARIAVSSARLLATSPALRPHRARAVVIPYGVDPRDWAPRPPAADELRARHCGPIVLFLGRLVRYKRVDLLMEAMNGLDATLLVVGDGPERRSLDRLAGGARVVFAGAVNNDQRAAYYHAADLFALPSPTRAEAFSMAMLEAMACGTPAICAEVGTGTSWLNAHGVTGVVVRSGDSDALRAAITELLYDEPARRAMGEAAARRVAEQFPKTAMLDALRSLYLSLAPTPARRAVAPPPLATAGSRSGGI